MKYVFGILFIVALIVLGTEIGNLIYFHNNFPEGVTTGNLLLYAASESISALMVVACLTLFVCLLAMWWDSHKKKQQQIIWKAEKEAESIRFEAKNDANHRSLKPGKMLTI